MFLSDAGLLEINGTFWIELAAFLLMMWILSRYAYPRIIAAAETRQKMIAAELEAAEKARAEAEQRLAEARTRTDEARETAQEIVSGANRSAEQLRREMREKAEGEARRLTEAARKEIEAEREKAIQSVRAEVAGMVVIATEKVIGESLDAKQHQRLIDKAIQEVASGDGGG